MSALTRARLNVEALVVELLGHVTTTELGDMFDAITRADEAALVRTVGRLHAGLGAFVRELAAQLLHVSALEAQLPEPQRAPETVEPEAVAPEADTLLGRVLEAANAARDPIDGCRCMPAALLDDIRTHLGIEVAPEAAP